MSPTAALLRLRRVGNAAAVADAYDADPELSDRDLATQQRAIDAARGPFSAPLAVSLRGHGWEADDLILGVPAVRSAWVREHGPLPTVRNVEDPDALLAIGEILRTRPAVVLDGNLNVLDRTVVDFLRSRVPEVRLLVGQMGTAKRFHRALDLDLSLVPCPSLAETVRPLIRGAVRVLPHSFDPAILDGLPPRTVAHPLVFAGALGPRYVLRHEVLMALLETTPIEAWIGLRKGVARTIEGTLDAGGTSSDGLRRRVARLAAGAPLPILAAAARRSDRFSGLLNTAVATRAGARIRDVGPLEDPAARFPDRCHPAVAGRPYLELLRRSGAVLHREGDELDGCGAALRQFEVTGVGAVLLADTSPMLRRLFEDGSEAILFDGPEDAVEKARWLLDHPKERERIAAAGQARTLRDHTTAVRAGQLADLLSEALSRVRARSNRR